MQKARRAVPILVPLILLTCFAIATAQPQDGRNAALVKAATEGNIEAARNALTLGADPNARDADKQTPLILASLAGRTDLVNLLLASKADVNALGLWQRTALHWALESNRAGVARLLIEHGADVRAVDSHGGMVVGMAVTTGDVGLVSLLLDKGADVEGHNEHFEPALYQAVGRGDVPMVRLLLARHANPNHGDMWVGSPLSKAIGTGSLELVNLLLDHGADPDGGMSENGTTNLMVAAGAGNLPIVQAMLVASRNVDAADRFGHTALMAAADAGHADVVRLLLARHADVKKAAQGGDTALSLARRGNTPGHREAAHLLEAAQRNSELPARSDAALSPLHAALHKPKSPRLPLPQRGTSVSVTTFGAKGDGLHDDTPAIQAAINALERRGGGILRIPKGVYLLNSYSRSLHPWFFYNLLVGSNIMLEGEPGARLLQGPNGRAAILKDATEVQNTMISFGSPNYVIITFQNPQYNGGFKPLKPTHANDQSVTLTTPSQASHFKTGDYVMIYSATTGDVIPSESSQVTSVSPTGVIGLKYRLARSFSTAWIANVTSLATVNTGISGLIVQGAEPIAITEAFGFTATGNTFISDTSIGGGNDYGLNMNTIRGFHFSHNIVTSIGPSYVKQELPQRNSQDVVIDSNAYKVRSMGFGEYGAHWTITHNSFSIHSDATAPAGIGIGGIDVLFSDNHIQGSASVNPIMADYVGLDAYAAYVGRIRIVNNVFDCRADQTNCLNIDAPDTIVSGNRFFVTGNTGKVILVEGPLAQTIQIKGNYLSVENGLGIVLNSPPIDNSVISGNIITGSGIMGIYVPSRATPNQGKHTIVGNTVTGFRQSIVVDLKMHPGTVVDSSTADSPHP